MSFNRSNIDWFLRNIKQIDNNNIDYFRFYQNLNMLSLFEFLVLIDDMIYESDSLYNQDSLFNKMLFFVAENYLPSKYNFSSVIESNFENFDEYTPGISCELVAVSLINHLVKNSNSKNYMIRPILHHHSNPMMEFEANHSKEWELTDETHFIGASYMSYIREIYLAINDKPITGIVKTIFTDGVHRTFYTSLLTEAVYNVLENFILDPVKKQFKKIKILSPYDIKAVNLIVKTYYSEYSSKNQLKHKDVVSWLTVTEFSSPLHKQKVSREELKDILALFKYLKEKQVVKFSNESLYKLLKAYFEIDISTHMIKKLYQDESLSSNIKSDFNRILQR